MVPSTFAFRPAKESRVSPDERRRIANVRQVDAVRRKQEPNSEESEAEHKLRMALAAGKQLSEELSFPPAS